MTRVTIAQLEAEKAALAEQLEQTAEHNESLNLALEARTEDLRVAVAALDDVLRYGVFRRAGIARNALNHLEESARAIPSPMGSEHHALVCDYEGCGKGPLTTGHAIYRISSLEEKFVGMCEEHYPGEPDPLARTIEQAEQRRRRRLG
jgi:hypothetical protein